MKNVLAALFFFASASAQPIGSWVLTDPVSDQDSNNMSVKVGVDAQCNAVAVWQNAENVGSDQVIQGAKLSFGSSMWMPTSTIAQAGDDLSNLIIEVAPNGDAVILYENNSLALFGARLPAGFTTWMPTTPSPIVTTLSLLSNTYSLSMNALGNSIAAWSELVMGDFLVRGARLDAGSTTWAFTNFVVTPATITDNSSPVVRINDCGDAVAIWEALDNGVSTLIGARLAAGSNDWKLTSTIPGILGDPIQYDLALDNSGRAIAVFIDQGVVKGAKLPKGSLTWGATSDLSDDSDNALPRLRVGGPKCIAVAIWETSFAKAKQSKASFAQDIESAVLPFDDTVWVNTNNLNSERSGDQAALAMDTFGNAIAVWRGDSSFIEGATLDAGSTTWVETNDLRMVGVGSSVVLPDVEVSPNGQLAVGAWTFVPQGSVEQIEAATICSPFSPQPPGLIFGKQIKNRFSSQSECFNRIFWTASPSGNIDFYRVFRNGAPIITVSSKSGLIFEDHNRRKGICTTYEVKAVGLNGKESDPASVAIK